MVWFLWQEKITPEEEQYFRNLKDHYVDVFSTSCIVSSLITWKGIALCFYFFFLFQIIEWIDGLILEFRTMAQEFNQVNQPTQQTTMPFLVVLHLW